MRIVTDIFGLSARGGLHLPAARLWLDGRARGDLAFVGELCGLPSKSSRILCSAELLQIWGETSRTMLAPPMGTRFQLGELHLELMNAGSTPGAAALAIEGGERDLLVATCARPDPLPLTAPLPPFDADVIVVDASLAAVAHASVAELRFAVDEALAMCLPGGRSGVVWLFDDEAIALAVAALVGNRAPLYASLGFKRWYWRYTGAALPVPRIRRLGHKAAPGSFILWPASRAEELTVRGTDDFAWTLAATLADAARADEVGAEFALPVSRRAAGTQLDQMIVQCGARDVVAIGAGAARLAERLAENPRARRDLSVWHLVDRRQLALWEQEQV
jgi:hypothetical protein